MKVDSFFAELKRRSVYKVAIAYGVVAWLLMQIASQIFPFFEIPNWAVRLVVLMLIIGFPVALIIAWAFELTPEGLKRTEVADAPPTPRSTHRTWIYVVIVAGAISIGLFFLGRYTRSTKIVGSGLSAKSIAVLPFENLSEEKGNAYFAEGIQDEILTRLAKIADLKVISRTSTQQYGSKPGSLSQIAKQLGVTNIVEGSVQKAEGQVRVNVQLINAQTDSHLWGDTYDRKLTDIFAVESEVAKSIAEALQARLTGGEKSAIDIKPTNNPDAYDAYLRAVASWSKLTYSTEDAENTINFYKRAVQLDPKFAEAWAGLAVAYLDIYNDENAPQRLAEVKPVIDTAFRLQPELGEAYFALGNYRYRILRDYDGALEAFEKAAQRGVSRAKTADFASYVKRRQGKWEESLTLSSQASELDPRNTNILAARAETYFALRRFQEAHATIERALEITPADPALLALSASVYQAEGDLKAARQLLDRVPLDGRDPELVGVHFDQWCMERRYSEAIKALRNLLSTPLPEGGILKPTFQGWLGLAELWSGDQVAGRSDLLKARDQMEGMYKEEGEVGRRLVSQLTFICAWLGDRACVERHAARMQKEIAADTFNGPHAAGTVAVAQAALGETDSAVRSLTGLLQVPGNRPVTPALLRLDPAFDPLRKDPQFLRLCKEAP